MAADAALHRVVQRLLIAVGTQLPSESVMPAVTGKCTREAHGPPTQQASNQPKIQPTAKIAAPPYHVSKCFI